MDKIAATISECVSLSGLGRTSIYKAIGEGKLKPRKAGKRTLILVSELKEYLENLPIAGEDK